MGLFDRFRRKDQRNTGNIAHINPEVLELYNRTSADMRSRLFYGDVKSAESILLKLKDCFNSLPGESPVAMAYGVYMQTWIRTKVALDPRFSTPSYIKEALCQKYSDIPGEMISSCVDASLEILYQNEPDLKQKADMYQMLKAMTDMKAGTNEAIQERYLSDPEYGLVPEKPIFVNGFGEDKNYLSQLTGENGEKLSFERITVTKADGIEGPVDCYQSYLQSHEPYRKLYVSVYGTRSFEKAPAGFRFSDSDVKYDGGDDQEATGMDGSMSFAEGFKTGVQESAEQEANKKYILIHPDMVKDMPKKE